VTSLVALVPPEELGRQRHRRAVDWLCRITGRETSPVFRLRRRRRFTAGSPVPDVQ